MLLFIRRNIEGLAGKEIYLRIFIISYAKTK